MRVIKVAVIGLGYWGPNIIRNFLKIPKVEVVGICDLSKDKIKKVLNFTPSAFATEDFRQILKNDQVDLIVIATPLRTHYELAKHAIMAGKHVLVEKPMTRTSQEAKKLITLASEKNRILMVGYTFVYNSAIKKIKSLIDQRKIGRVFYYDSTRINLGLIQSDTNVIWDLAPHDLSILNYIFLEKPLTIQAFGASFINRPYEEIAHLIIKYENNIFAHINISWLSPVKIRRILIGGSKKMILYNDIEPSEKIKIYDKGVSIPISKVTPFSPAYRGGNIVVPNISQDEALFNELEHVISCIRSKTKPLTDGVEGLKIIKILEAADQSLKTKSPIQIKQ